MSDAMEKEHAKLEDVPTMIIVSRAKDYIDALHAKSGDTKFAKMRIGAGFAGGLNYQVATLVREAVLRAKANGRATVYSCDL